MRKKASPRITFITRNATGARWAIVFVVLLFALIAPAHIVWGQSVTFRIGIYDNPPLSFIDRNGLPAGLTVDILQAVASEENWRLEFVTCDWVDCLAMLQSGEIDLLGAVAYSDERAQVFDFNAQTYFVNWGVVYTPASNPIESLLDLDGKRLACVENDIYTLGVQSLLSKLGANVEYITAKDYAHVFEMLENGQVDAGIVARLFGLVNEADYRVSASPIILSPVQLRYAATKGQHTVELQRIDFYLETWKREAGSPYYVALDNWLSHHHHTERVVPVWLGWAIAGLAGWVIVAMLMIGFLRRRVGIHAKALGESEDRFKRLFDAAVLGVFQSTPDAEILTVNPAYAQMFGYDSPKDLMSAIADVGGQLYVYPELRPTIIKTIMDSQGPVQVEIEYRRKDGSSFTGSLRVWKVYDRQGVFQYLEGFVEDVTERKRSDEKIRAAETRLRALVEQVPAIVYTESADERGKTLYISPQIETLTGYSVKDWMDRKFAWRKYVHPDDLDRLVAEDERTGLTGAPFRAEYRIITRAENFVWVRDDAVLITDPEGKPLFWQGVMHDISDRKRAEKNVERHLTELQALYENGIAIGRLLDPKEIGQNLVETFSRVLSWNHVSVRLRRGESDEAELIAFAQPGLTPNEIKEVEKRFASMMTSMDKGLSGLAVQTGRVIRVGNVRDYPQYVGVYAAIQSGLYAPLKSGERIIGCISVESESLDAFSEQDERLLATLAAQASIAFDNARLYQAAIRDIERRMVLHRASQEIVSTGLNSEELYVAIHQAVANLMPNDVFTIAMQDHTRQDVAGVYFVEQGKRYPEIHFKKGEGFSGYVIQRNQSLRIDDYSLPESKNLVKLVSMKKTRRPRSILAVPLHFGENVIGAMSVQSYHANVYSDEDQVLLEMLAAYAGYALENTRLFEAERKQRQLSDALRDALGAGASLGSSLDSDIVLDRLLEELEHVVPFDGGCIMFVQPASRRIRIARTRGYIKMAPEWLAEIQKLDFEIESTENLHWMYENKQPLVIPDVTKYPGWVQVEGGLFTRSWAGAPIVVNDEVVAFFSLDNTEPEFFTREQALLLNSFAGQASLALQNARLFEQTHRRAERLSMLYEVSQKLSGLMDMESIGDIVIPIIEALLGWTRGSIWLLEENGIVRMLYHNTYGLDSRARQSELERLRSLVTNTDEGIIGWVVKNGQVVRCGNVRENAHYIEGDASIRSELCAPLQISDQTVGCINFESEIEDAFSKEDERVITTIASEISGAIERARLYEQIRHRADELGALAAENERLLAETQRRLQFVSALHTIDTAIASSLDMTLILNIILDQTLVHLGVDAAAIYLLDPHLQELVLTAGRGVTSLRSSRLQLSQAPADVIVLERQFVEIPDLSALKKPPKHLLQAAADGFEFYAAVPLVAKGEVKGMLEVFHRAQIVPDSEWLEYVQTLAGQAALAIDASAMFSELQRANVDLSLAYDATIEGWSNALDLRDEDTEGHTQRVTDLTLKLARQVGVGEADMVHIWRGALLHDIGKMGVPDSILRKPGPLDEKETEIMRRHPVDAFRLLSKISYLEPALDIPYCHHERWDGTGYPRGLAGEQIPLAARIFAVVDVWDALCSNRPYRKAWTREKALEHIIAQSGSHFEPRIVDAFLELVRSEK